MRKDRLLEFIPSDRYDQLDDETRENLLSYRKLFYNIKRKEGKIERMTQKLKDEKELISEMKQDLTSRNSFIDHLRKNFYFTCSVVSFKKGNKVYYNITVSRKGDRSKNISLGNEETVRQHLSEYYNDKSFLHKSKDWKSFLKVELNSGETYTKILDMILDNPLGFKNLTINRHTLFPLKNYMDTKLTQDMRLRLMMEGYDEEKMKNMTMKQGWDILLKK